MFYLGHQEGFDINFLRITGKPKGYVWFRGVLSKSLTSLVPLYLVIVLVVLASCFFLFIQVVLSKSFQCNFNNASMILIASGLPIV